MLVHLQREFTGRTQNERAEDAAGLCASCESLLFGGSREIGRQKPVQDGKRVGEGFTGTLGEDHLSCMRTIE